MEQCGLMMMSFLKEFLTPPTSGNADKDQAARLLYGLLPPLVFIIAVYFVFVSIFLPSYVNRGLILLTSITAVTVMTLTITKKGHPIMAGVFCIVTLYIVVTLLALTAGGIHAPAALSYFVLIFVAGFVLGERAGLITAAVCILSNIGFYAIEKAGLLWTPMVQPSLLSTLIITVMFLSMMALFQYQARRNLRRLLEQANKEAKERLMANSALKQSEHLLIKMFDTIPDAIILSRMADGLVVDVNPGFERIFQFTRQETIGRTSQSMETWVYPEERKEVINEVRNSGEVRHKRISFRRKDGMIRKGMISCRAFDLNGEPHLVFTLEDITAQHDFETAFQENEAKFKKTFNHAPVLMTISTLEDGRFIEVNDRCFEFSGYRPDEVIGRTATDLQWITPEQRTMMLGLLSANGRIVDMDLDLRKKNGDIIHRLYSCETIMLGGKRCLLSISIDITQRKLAEEFRQKLESELLQSQKMESIGRLAGGIAHDFNNMLTPILGYSELLKKTFPEDDKRRHRLDQIVRAAESSRNLVMNLLAFARKQNLEMKPVDLSTVIADFSKILHRVVRENVTLTLNLDPEAGLIYGDPGQMEQVLLNLCVNAHDAMPDGGIVTVETSAVTLEEALPVGNETIPAGSYVRLTVRDTGMGIKSELVSMIFEPFFTTKEKGKGTGLGLSTVYGIVKQHKGYIAVESVPGTGTVFTLFFPRWSGTLAEKGTGEGSTGELSGTGRILVAEDNAEVRMLVEETLTQYGYSVTTADSLADALQIFRSGTGPVDLLVSDVLFADGNGTELYDEMKKVLPHLKVLYMSGYSGEIISRHNVVNDGINFIAKPFMPDELAAKVRVIVSGHSAPG